MIHRALDMFLLAKTRSPKSRPINKITLHRLVVNYDVIFRKAHWTKLNIQGCLKIRKSLFVQFVMIRPDANNCKKFFFWFPYKL